MLIRKVEKYLRDNDMSASSFGRRTCSDPRLVFDLRMGRIVRPETQEKIEKWMKENDKTADNGR